MNLILKVRLVINLSFKIDDFWIYIERFANKLMINEYIYHFLHLILSVSRNF